MTDRWTDRLSEYLDGDLPDNERVALEAHLQECAECPGVLADLRQVVSRAHGLEPLMPAQDLWPAIARRIGATPRSDTAVIDLASHPKARRRWTFSLPQLAAAGIALMSVSGGTVWLLSKPARAANLAVTDTVTAHPPRETPIVPVGGIRPNASQSYAAAVADLERVLAEGRGRLDTTTVRVIEQNLAAIDRAIAEAQRALDADSANLYLNTHLAETMRRKLELLRQAASLVRVS